MEDKDLKELRMRYLAGKGKQRPMRYEELIDALEDEVRRLRDCCRALKPFAEAESLSELEPDAFEAARDAYKNAGVE